jgi:hypothetical protein
MCFISILKNIYEVDNIYTQLIIYKVKKIPTYLSWVNKHLVRIKLPS